MSYANEVDDLDFWWHLRNGQLIYETQTIPQKDDFAYTTYVPDNISRIGKDEVAAKRLPGEKSFSGLRSSNLSNSWLSQLIFYIVYLLAGFKGIGILKSAVFVLAYLVVYLTMRRRGAGNLSSFLILSLIAVIGVDFNYTRPQIFSFLLFPAVLYTLYDFRRGGKSIYLLPLFMLIWANLHGGFILGVLTILAFTFSETIKYLLLNRFNISKISSLQKEQLRTLILLSSVSAFASLINPNGAKIFLLPLIVEQSLFKAIEEYYSPMLYEYHAYWFMLVITAVCILILTVKRRLDLSDLLIALILIVPSLRSIRYIIFFALGSGVFLAYSISSAAAEIKERGFPGKLLNNQRFAEIIRKSPLSILISILSIIYLIMIIKPGDVMELNMRLKRYPSGAVSFIQDNMLSGNMFNLYNWGGYLIWSLYPDYRVFIDGRNLNETNFFHYKQILKAEAGKRTEEPLWVRLLDAYKVNFILTNAVTSAGRIVPLVDKLYLDSAWELIYADGKSMIFLRSTLENQDTIHTNYISKDKIYDEIITECKLGIAETPATWGYYETLGDIYMAKNRLEDAFVMFHKYLSMNPNNKKVRHSYDLLKRYLKK